MFKQKKVVEHSICSIHISINCDVVSDWFSSSISKIDIDNRSFGLHCVENTILSIPTLDGDMNFFHSTPGVLSEYSECEFEAYDGRTYSFKELDGYYVVYADNEIIGFSRTESLVNLYRYGRHEYTQRVRPFVMEALFNQQIMVTPVTDNCISFSNNLVEITFSRLAPNQDLITYY